jgi:hypothetical protein
MRTTLSGLMITMVAAVLALAGCTSSMHGGGMSGDKMMSDDKAMMKSDGMKKSDGMMEKK